AGPAPAEAASGGRPSFGRPSDAPSSGPEPGSDPLGPGPSGPQNPLGPDPLGGRPDADPLGPVGRSGPEQPTGQAFQDFPPPSAETGGWPSLQGEPPAPPAGRPAPPEPPAGDGGLGTGSGNTWAFSRDDPALPDSVREAAQRAEERRRASAATESTAMFSPVTEDGPAGTGAWPSLGEEPPAPPSGPPASSEPPAGDGGLGTGSGNTWAFSRDDPALPDSVREAAQRAEERRKAAAADEDPLGPLGAIAAQQASGRDQGPAEPPASGPTPGAWGPEAAQGPSYEGTQAMPALRDVPIGGTAPPDGGEGGYRPDDRYDERYGDRYPEDGRDGGYDRRPEQPYGGPQGGSYGEPYGGPQDGSYGGPYGERRPDGGDGDFQGPGGPEAWDDRDAGHRDPDGPYGDEERYGEDSYDAYDPAGPGGPGESRGRRSRRDAVQEDFPGFDDRPPGAVAGDAYPGYDNIDDWPENEPGAVRALWFGIIALVPVVGLVTAVLALITGPKAVRAIRASDGALEGESLARIG